MVGKYISYFAQITTTIMKKLLYLKRRDIMKKSALEQKWQIFIGHAKMCGATEDELEILVKAMDLIKKYSPNQKIES